MRVVFIGVTSIGWYCLKALLERRANVVGIFTANKQKMVDSSGMHPDYFSEFDQLAEEWGVPLYKVGTVDVPLDIESITGLNPDLIFCVGWPQIMKNEILEIPPYGCIGSHPTLLPERRGGAPINWCLIDGLTRGGVTLFYFDEGIDSGDIIAQQEFEISLKDTAATVLDKVTGIAAQLLHTYYTDLQIGKARRITQDHTKATYTRRRRPDDGIIDWRATSLYIYNWIRALTTPFPGAFTLWNGRRVVIWESQLLTGYRPRLSALPGEILDSIPGQGMVIATGDYCILVKRAECDGANISGDELINRFKVCPGSILGEV